MAQWKLQQSVQSPKQSLVDLVRGLAVWRLSGLPYAPCARSKRFKSKSKPRIWKGTEIPAGLLGPSTTKYDDVHSTQAQRFSLHPNPIHGIYDRGVAIHLSCIPHLSWASGLEVALDNWIFHNWKLIFWCPREQRTHKNKNEKQDLAGETCKT